MAFHDMSCNGITHSQETNKQPFTFIQYVEADLPRKENDENAEYFWLPSVDMWKSLVKPFDQIVKVLTAPTNHRESCVWSCRTIQKSILVFIFLSSNVQRCSRPDCLMTSTSKRGCACLPT